MRFFALIFSIIISCASMAQSTDTTLISYFNRLPELPATAEQVHAQYYPKTKTPPYQALRAELKKKIVALADQSDHKSRLLSMLAGRFEDESGRYDFSKINNPRDKALTAAIDHANAAYFSALDDYSRQSNSNIDSVLKQAGAANLHAQWEVYKKEIPILIKNIRRMATTLDKFMNEKGYTQNLMNEGPNYIYYIQVLEARALILDRLIRLVEMIDGAQASISAQYI